MPERQTIAKELASILRIIAHPDRIRIIENLAREEKDVTTLLNELALPGPRVSQHLSVLRAYRIVDGRREGRRHLYRVIQPQLAGWMMRGLDVIESENGWASPAA